MQKIVLAFGETLWDLLPGGAVLGGAPFNFAYRVKSLGDHGFIVTRLGQDELGREAAERIAALGMEARYIQWDENQPTGTVRVTLDAQRNPDYDIVTGVAYDSIEATREALELAGRADCLCFGTLVQRAPKARQTLRQVLDAAKPALKLLDINLRKACYCLETVRDSLLEADILKMNQEEAKSLAELLGMPHPSLSEFCRAMIERWKLACCLVTLGERGALAVSAEGKTVYIPGYRVSVTDACGSGDAFTAGFLHEYLRQEPLEVCCQLGNAMGALVASQSGATAPLRVERIEQFLNASQERVFEPSLKAFILD